MHTELLNTGDHNSQGIATVCLYRNNTHNSYQLCGGKLLIEQQANSETTHCFGRA